MLRNNLTKLILSTGIIALLGFASSGQTTGLGVSCVYGRWGIDAGLYSGVIEFGAGVEPASPRSNDWFQGTAGRGIIDESNFTSLQALLQAPGNPIYERRMKFGLVSILDNQILIDGIYARDHFGGTGFTDPTSFLTASKNGEDPAIWDPGQMNVLGKNDIIDVGGHMFRDGTDYLSSDLWFVGLFNMAEPGGVSYMDFEFFVEDIDLVPRAGGGIKFTSGGPQLGHTSYNFDGQGNITKIGDFIFSVSLLSSGPLVETRLWVSYADWVRLGGPSLATNPTFKWAGTFDGPFNGSPYGYAGITPLNDGKVCGYVNQTGQLPLAPPWGTKGTKTNSWGTNYIASSIAEVGINLTSFGMDHISLSGADPCYFPLNTYIVKTRASASFTAQLKDFAGPFGWGQPQFNIIFDNSLISCDNSTATITAVPQRSDVNYKWSTADGSITGVQPYNPPMPTPYGNSFLVDPFDNSIILGVIPGTEPWKITIDKVGTYQLSIELPNNCPVPSGRITVGLDPGKPYFNGTPTFSYTVPCNTNNGTVTVTASGATKPYTFFLYKDNVLQTSFTANIAASSHTFTGLTAGNYRVDVKGVYACIETTGTINLPAPVPVLVSETLTHVKCFGLKTGKIELDVSGGSSPLSYLWSTGNTSQNLLNVGAGSYTVTITDSYNCQTIRAFTINQPTQLVATIMKTDDLGNAGNGSATVNVTGGTAPYSYEWTKIPLPVVIGTNATLSNIGYGEYLVKVTDANGCFVTATIFIYEKEICNDGIDNDGDGLTDCDDPECTPEQPGVITASDDTPCVDPDGVAPYTYTYTYSVPINLAYDSYVWTVPSGSAVIVSGQGTNQITVAWISLAGGQICVRGKKYECLSAPRCITVIVDDVPPQPGDIIINNN